MKIASVRGLAHQLLVDLVGRQQLLRRARVGLAHRDPGVGDHAVGAAHRLVRIVGQLDGAALALAPSRAPSCSGLSCGGQAIAQLEAEAAPPPGSTTQRRCCRRRPRRRVRPVIGPCRSSKVIMSAMIWQGWRRVGQAVDHRHGGVLGQLDHVLVVVGADHDRVDIARQHLAPCPRWARRGRLHVAVVERDASPPSWRMATSNETRVRVEGFSKISASTASSMPAGLQLRRHALAGLLHGARHVEDAPQRRRPRAVEIEEMPGRHGADGALVGDSRPQAAGLGNALAARTRQPPHGLARSRPR